MLRTTNKTKRKNKPMPIDKKYIDDHLSVHTAESFARALSEQVLKAAADKVGATTVDVAEVDAKFTVSEFKPAGCIRVCANINGVMVCYHVNI
jgi:hypothetical protein